MLFSLFNFEVSFKEKCFWISIAAIKNSDRKGRALFYFAYIEDIIEFDLLYFITNRE